MPTEVKICGLSEPLTLDAAVEAGATHVGFVFFPPSPRAIGLERARSLAARVPGHVRKVGVFVSPDDALLEQAAGAAALDAIQLHGEALPARAAAVRERFQREVWVAIPVRQRADLVAADRYAGAADRLLFDAKAPKGSSLPGGNGVRFDWRLLHGIKPRLAWGLSGGLDPSNVAEAIGRTGAPLVDVSSGVEDGPGVKSADRIRAFFKAVGERR